MNNKSNYVEINLRNSNNRRTNVKRSNNRKEVVFHKKLSVIIATMSVMFSLMFTVCLVANAKEDEQPLYKYYQSYMVEKGDTLLSIAYDMNADNCTDKQIQECVNEMISINSLDHKGTICYGNYILVPYYSTEYR